MPELEFQRPAAEVELSRADARAREIRNGDLVTVTQNGTSIELRARVSGRLRAGVVAVPSTHGGALHAGPVEVRR